MRKMVEFGRFWAVSCLRLRDVLSSQQTVWLSFWLEVWPPVTCQVDARHCGKKPWQTRTDIFSVNSRNLKSRRETPTVPDAYRRHRLPLIMH